MDRESDRGSSEAGSGRGTPRSLADQETMRSDTPGTMPTYQYSLEELYELEKAAASQIIPDCLDKEFIVDGVWDAERWHRSFAGSGSNSKSGSRGPSPQTLSDPRERRGEMMRRNSGSSLNPKDRLKEDKDCIVLSPQRRSFGTGCHVSTQQPLLQRALSNIESERRQERRIGSGRIQIDRERSRDAEYRTERGRDQDYRSERDSRGRDGDFRSDRDFRNDRGMDRNDRDFRNERVMDRDRDRDFRNDRFSDKDPRDFRNSRDMDRDRDFRNSRDRFDRDDRRFERDRDRIFTSRRDLDDRRDFRDHSGRYNHRRDRQDSNREEEPEWFSSGPVSKSDTIELHGFERERKDSENQKEKPATKQEVVQEAEEEIELSTEEVKHNEEGISVADRNGSLETNESSSPETNQSDPDSRPTKPLPAHLPFDFNEFFMNIPGLNVPDDSLTDTDSANIGGSRFYQQYRTSLSGNQQNIGGSKENSRRSSLMEDDFGYLNDLLNGSKSPVIPSPPPPSASSLFDRSMFTPFSSGDKQQLLEFGIAGQKFGSPSNTSLVNALINNAILERHRASPPGIKNSPQETEAKLKALLFGRLDSASSSGNTTPGFNSPLNAPIKVKTVAELEGELRKENRAKASTPPTQVHRDSPTSGSDLTAFNKLISLMQAGAAKPVETPKPPVRVEQRVPSPLSSLTAHLQAGHIQQGHRPGQPVNLPTHMQATPSQSHQGRIIHKPEPLNLQPQNIQNQRNSLGDVPYDLMDGYHGNMSMSTPTTVAPPSFQSIGDASAAQKQFLEALQRNKVQQLQIRQATMQNMRLGQQNSASMGQQLHLTSQALANQNTPSQQTLSSVQMQASQNTPSQQQQSQPIQGRRSSNGDPIMSFLKANPTIITKPASPTPPPQQAPQIPIVNFVQTGTSPRGPSPSPLQSTLMSRQAPGSPRVPSPIMFSQQPPMHLSAPSPIHPAQGGGSHSQSPVAQAANSSSVNTIRPPSVPRVPSPQELIVHTQAILQNALIKKQLEDQKERFYKKQQERAKSPVAGGPKLGPDVVGTPSSSIVQSSTSQVAMTSTPIASKASAVNVAFTPTSVIRKMHSEKASEKEKQRRDSIDSEQTDKDHRAEGQDGEQRVQNSQVSPQRPDHHHQQQQQQSLTTQASSVVSLAAPPTSIPPPAVIHAVPPPPLPNQVLSNMVVIPGLPPFNTNHLTHLPPPPSLVSTHLPPPLLSPGTLPPPPHPQATSLVTQEQLEAVKSQHIRALIGQQQQQQHHASVTSTLPTSGRPIVKGVVSVAPPTSVQKDLGQRPIVGSSTPMVTAVDVAKLLQRQHLANTPHIIPRGQTTTPYAVPITGRLPLPTSPVIGPQPPAPGTSPVYIPQMVSNTTPRGYGQYPQLAGQRMMDPRAARGPIIPTSLQNQGFNPRTFTPHSVSQHKNGPISPGVPVSMVSVSNSSKPDNINLMKWFNTDVLKTQLPTMPPLPVQGQRVLTLDEIERS